MPNFRLTEADVKNVLEFIQKQTELRMGGAKGEFSAAPAPATSTESKPPCPGCVKNKKTLALTETAEPKTWKPARGGVPPLKEPK